MENLIYSIAFGGIPLDIGATVCNPSGSKDVVLCIHGLGSSRKTFRYAWMHHDKVVKEEYMKMNSGSDVVVDLPSQCCLVAVDLVGYGESSKSAEFSYDMADQAKVVAIVLEKYFSDRTSLRILAHSMGGPIGLLLTKQIPEKTAMFVCLEGNLTAADCGIMSRGIIKTSFLEFDATGLTDLQKLHPTFGIESCTDALYRSSRSLVKWSENGTLLNTLTHLPCETLYIFGEKNKDIPTVHEVTKLGISTVMISASGHSPQRENAPEFYATLEKNFRLS